MGAARGSRRLGGGLSPLGLGRAAGSHLQRGGPPSVSWLGDLGAEECVFSKHLVHGRWQPQLPFSLQFRLHFPSLGSPSC